MSTFGPTMKHSPQQLVVFAPTAPAPTPVGMDPGLVVGHDLSVVVLLAVECVAALVPFSAPEGVEPDEWPRFFWTDGTED